MNSVLTLLYALLSLGNVVGSKNRDRVIDTFNQILSYLSGHVTPKPSAHSPLIMPRAAGSSYTDGAEDFVYLLNECLLNYGSLIVAELFKSALPLQSLRQSPPIEPPKYADAVASASPGEGSYAHKRNPHPPTTYAASPVIARTPTVQDGRKEYDKSNEHDENSAQLRRHIRSMRSNVKDDPSILLGSEVAGLSSAKTCLEEFAASFFHFPHLTARLRH